ncbi:hypothetical protein [Rhodococcus sp. NPDC004095]
MSKKESQDKPALMKFLVPAVGEVEAEDFDDLAKKLDSMKDEEVGDEHDN